LYSFKNISLFLVGFIVLVTCDTAPTGEFVENNPPSTFLTVEQINREGDFRLSSQINISWWGTDSDGYIVGYEYAINDTSENAWRFTTKTDSTFILPIEEGLSEDNVLFKVRAIDDDGAVDTDGARLVFPIVNSAPSVSLNQTELPADTMFSIVSFGWTIDDIDGLGNISRTEVAINDTINGWVEIPIPVDENRLFINLQIDNTVAGSVDADVFQGRSFATLPGVTIPGININQSNTFYVRAIDNAGAISNVDSTSWFVKPKTSSTLFLNDFSGSASQAVSQFHKSLLAANGIIPDQWIINDGEVAQEKVALSSAFPAVTDPTLKKTLNNWDHIYWISNDIDRNITYALDIASEFFDEGGTMFVNIPMKGISQTDEIFSFLPVDSIGVLSGIQTNFLLNANTPVESPAGINAPELSMSNRIVGNFPLKPSAGATLLYSTNFLATTLIGFNQDYLGNEAIAIENAERNLIYFSIDMRDIDGNNNLDDMLDELIIQRLNFKQ
jgi:hypothetical protein